MRGMLARNALLGGTLRAYFIDAGGICQSWQCCYWRVVLLERARQCADRTGQWLAVTVGALFFPGAHPNPSNAAFAMPFLLWPALEGYDRAKHWQSVPAVVFVGMLLQYGYLYKVNRHEGFDSRDFDQVSKGVAESANLPQIPNEEIHVCGDYSLWFAHPDHYSAYFSSSQGSERFKANL